MNEQDCRNHPAWGDFWKWAKANGCDADYIEVWGLWWKCFLAGFDKGREDEANIPFPQDSYP